MRVANIHCSPSAKFKYTDPNGIRRKASNPEWHIMAISASGDSASFSFHPCEIQKALDSAWGLSITPRVASSTLIPDSFHFTSGLDFSKGVNAFILQRRGQTLSLLGGNREYLPLASLTLPSDFPISSISIGVDNGGLIKISDIFLETLPSPAEKLFTPYSSEAELMLRICAKSNPKEGLWTILDSSLDESLLQLGGDYTLALISNRDCIDLIFLSGARIMKQDWKTGLLKARLTPTLFNDIYNVTWYDAEMRPLSYEIKAQFDSDGLLTIQFPFQGSRIRLAKVSQSSSR